MYAQKVQDLQNGYSLKIFNKNNNSKDNSVIYFEQDTSSSSNNVGRIILNLTTLNQEKINLSYQNLTAKSTRTKWFCKLQYRLNKEMEWKDIKDKRGHNIEFVSTRKRYAKNFSVTLPADCNNRQSVEISWLIDSYSKDKSNCPDILLHNINITSDFDKYYGVPAEIKVYLSSDDNKKDLQSIYFDKIPLPYIYPATTRIAIEAKNIRDSITLRIAGLDAKYFYLSQSSINEKQSSYKAINVNYQPKKEGRHRAELIIESPKQSQSIEIPLEGSCAKHVSYDKNILPANIVNSNHFSYHIPIFSNNDYQYKFTQKQESLQTICIQYHWYRDNTLLFSMYDTTKKQEYCAPLKAPNGATALDIELNADKDMVFSEYYFGSPKVKTMIHSGYWSDADNWKPKGKPGVEDFVVIDKGVCAKVDDDVACSMLILDDSANVSINTGKTFYVSNDIFYNKNAWFTVHQYLLPSRWNYISSPVNQAVAAIFSMKNASLDNDSWFMQYNTGKKSKHEDYWSEYITDPKFTLTPARGYAVYTHDAINVKYEGLLCNSVVTISLISKPEDKWNMIGNPYTAPLSSKKLFDDIDGRIQGNAIMLFDRESKVYNPLIIDSKEEVMIPSLESFFVEALNTPTDITFKRSQQYIPKTSEQSWRNYNYLNLSVRKGAAWQYVLLGMDSRSSYDFDEYDCHKMFGNNEDMPDIYLADSNDEYAVCVFPDYPACYDIGLYIGSSSDIEININNLSIMPDYVMIFVEDKTTNDFYDFCSEGRLKLSLKSGTVEPYRIHILKSQSIDNNPNSGIFLWTDKGRILFYSDTINKIEKLTILKNGKNLYNQEIQSGKVFYHELVKGKYQLKVLINGKNKTFDFSIK